MNSTVIKSLAFIFIFQLSIRANAGTAHPEGNSPLGKQISKQMNFPKSLISDKKEKTQVRICFMINANGLPEILAVNGPTEELKQYVVRSILTTSFGENTEKNKEYNMVFNFRQL
ncbi:MAG: hypothetical protein K0S33_4286 [Bacteroidetes bacterium]|jgi:hypothetical protein|nr:hypothetical protein [Bacteroidota bacterium]